MQNKFNIFKRWPILLAALVSITVCSGIWAVSSSPHESPIRQLKIEVPNQRGMVVEFFWYECSHCKKLDPAVEAWSQTLPDGVEFIRVPVAFGEAGAHQQRMYYSLLHMGKLQALHPLIFKAIHSDGVKFDSPEKIAQWVAQQGVNREQFEAVFDSGIVTGDLLEAHRLEEKYDVQSVPSIGVYGRSYITQSRMSASDMLSLAHLEVAKEHALK